VTDRNPTDGETEKVDEAVVERHPFDSQRALREKLVVLATVPRTAFPQVNGS